MRGAPQVGFSATIWKIKSRICLEILRPPPIRFRTLQSTAQYSFEPSLMPPHHRLGEDQKERLFPVGPETARHDPEEFVKWTQSGSRVLAFQDGELLAEGEVL